MAELLTDDDVRRVLSDLPGWSRDGDAITRTVTCASFLAGIDLVRRVADAAESADHHPDIDIRWTAITFRLSTHSAGGITDKDVTLARTIDSLIS
ncbi:MULTISPECIES: 4a-hydroxytetrahydrobiopterin dehydratase [Nocardiaceae]|uniref:Putative pterin-4-alpha-carbinolamine dehydratase n=1 Tax=Rhodococcoides kroppenstedtii TaxID=293050 RepID=A0ABS7NP02_9NOCA|nr:MULTISPECIES: 4a-hydroxytetrahydrobiopterin dehydratase [Rhodococcus]AMY19714.1 Putative pterin-4-alpha-carbinolamine dehydratase [Rhodococcus sp. PBTS 1]MBY6312172.1 4a-hydroxytetrahydrobiopterin dehydratase [Rhodococcus kroppenstedtii]MBY6319744.1 4a-hydroxytetrahydrobiopterin dehydratase [Rhodococcus kroppenstedtii]MBY6398427.1 4a-hydroxytetrahydrobiopterin dehydratase [Rhodococcus kroppenstedtii]